NPALTYSAASAGTMNVTYQVTANGCLDTGSSCIGFTVGPVTFTSSGPCTLAASGGDYTCHLESNSISIFEPCPAPGFSSDSLCPTAPQVSAKVVSDVTLSPDTLNTLRSASYSGGTPVTNPLQLSENATTDPLSVPCSAAVGDSLSYGLGDFTSTQGISVATSVEFDLAISSPVPTPLTPLFPYFDATSGSVPVSTTAGSIAMTGSGFSLNLGNVQPNNIPPTLTVASSFSGDEGSSIPFHASATGPCAAGGSYVWKFSDGGTEFGANPTHIFTDGGPYTGSVTITDTTGLTATQDFSVAVNNLPPAVKVIPTNPTVAWGRDLTISAQASDPGSTDGPLTYQWTFGDATPVVVGGHTETHQWAKPGVYAASVQVCDTHGACTTAPMTVTVVKRATSLGYTGDTSGTYSASATMSGSLVDQFGNPVNGGAISFSLGGNPAGSASTNSAGNATTTTVVGLSAGSYPVSAAYAGDDYYLPATSDPGSFAVSAMSSSLNYTGAVFGRPNKAVPLSATLTDAQGRPLAGRVVTFALGNQTVTATTSATGVASTSLTLNQKPGVYTLTNSWPGAAGQYLGASRSASFSINTK
ncbi:MAG: PKD domain-containing protein, partial [Marmoricola sp.]